MLERTARNNIAGNGSALQYPKGNLPQIGLKIIQIKNR